MAIAGVLLLITMIGIAEGLCVFWEWMLGGDE